MSFKKKTQEKGSNLKYRDTLFFNTYSNLTCNKLNRNMQEYLALQADLARHSQNKIDLTYSQGILTPLFKEIERQMNDLITLQANGSGLDKQKFESTKRLYTEIKERREVSNMLFRKAK